jgi:two-component system, sensor histidine kinase YesM
MRKNSGIVKTFRNYFFGLSSIIVLLLTAFFTYSSFQEQIAVNEKLSIDYVNKVMLEINIKAENFSNRLNNISSAIEYDSRLIFLKNFDEKNLSSNDLYELSRTIELLGDFNSGQRINIFIKNLKIANAKYLSDLSNYKSVGIANDILSKPKDQFTVSYHEIESDNPYINIYVNITEIIGRQSFIEYRIPLAEFTDLIQVNQLSPYHSVYFSINNKINFRQNGANNVFFHSDIQETLSNQAFIGSSSRILDFSLAVTHQKYPLSPKITSTILLSLILLLLLVLLVRAISVSMTRLVFAEVYDLIDDIGSGQNDLENTEKTEMDFIRTKFNQLMINYKNEVEVRMENERRAIKFEQHLLQEKINPHLLFNSLSYLRHHSMNQEDFVTVSMLESLIKFYRLALNQGMIAYSLEQEITLIKEYVRVVSITHESYYDLQLDISDDCKSIFIPKHFLLPIIENAIKHGLKGTENNLISIKCYKDSKLMYFDIFNNGRSIPDEMIKQILEMTYTSYSGGFGLRNLIQRIRFFYHDEASIDIVNKTGGVTFIIKVPLSIDLSLETRK